MSPTLSKETQTQLTELAHELQYARAEDLEDFTNSLTTDTYRFDGSLFYWPNGHKCSVEELNYLKKLSPTEKQLIERIENETQFTYLGHGVGRVAFTIETMPDYIVKLGRWGIGYIMGNGVHMNHSEYQFFQHAKETLENSPLLPIIQIGDQYDWILQEKITLYENYEKPKPDFETVLKNINERLGPFAALIQDKSTNNIGYADGEWYLLDYGKLI